MFREEREKMLREMRDGPATGTRAGGEEGAEEAKEKEAAHVEFVNAATRGVDWEARMRAAINKQAPEELAGPVPGIKYVADWLSAEDAACLERAVRGVRTDKWVQLRASGSTLQQWGGIAGGDPADPKTGPFPVPEYQQSLGQRLVTEGVFTKETAPNHVLVNLYKPGQGIMAHRDGPAYHNTVAIVSLGAPCIMSFYPVGQNETEAPSAPRIGLVLQPRSLLVFRGEAYDSYLHSIAETKREMVGGVGGPIVNAAEAGVSDGDMIVRHGPRISLTIRHVPSLIK